MPFDYLCSGVIFVFGFFLMPWWATLLLGVPIVLYNSRSFLRRDHRLYFITKREYQQHFGKMEN
jgi:hypothetical protein